MCEGKGRSDNVQPFGKERCSPDEFQRGTPSRLPYHFNFQPVNTEADSSSQGFGGRFLGGESRRQAFCRFALPQTVGLLGRCVHALQKAISKSVQRLLDSRNLNQIDPTSNDHLVFNVQQSTKAVRSRFSFTLEQDGCLGPFVSQSESHSYQGATIGDPEDDLTDEPFMKRVVSSSRGEGATTMPWVIEMTATSIDNPVRLARFLTGAILACGGWVLTRGTNDSGEMHILFEFERHACVEIYGLLVASGLELTAAAHSEFTELCRCTRAGTEQRGREIASIYLEVKTNVPIAGKDRPIAILG